MLGGGYGPGQFGRLLEASRARVRDPQAAEPREHSQAVRGDRARRQHLLPRARVLLGPIALKAPETQGHAHLALSQTHHVPNLPDPVLPEQLLLQEDRPLRPQTPEHHVPPGSDQDPRLRAQQTNR